MDSLRGKLPWWFDGKQRLTEGFDIPLFHR